MNTKGGGGWYQKGGVAEKAWEPLAYSIRSLFKFNMYCRKPVWHIIS